jgi:hypothetical protein
MKMDQKKMVKKSDSAARREARTLNLGLSPNRIKGPRANQLCQPGFELGDSKFLLDWLTFAYLTLYSVWLTPSVSNRLNETAYISHNFIL